MTPVGEVLLISSNDKLMGLYIKEQKNFPVIEQEWEYNGSLDIFSTIKMQLDKYFTSGKSSFTIDYVLNGTNFQTNVWKTLLEIPCGKVLTYKAFASLTLYYNAIRAVASAIGKNPLSIFIPCHRVISSDGSLGGYAAGLDIKKKLLHLEVPHLY
jgi:methylated-DNA-[protein]-cysteine S-methyltransferase